MTNQTDLYNNWTVNIINVYQERGSRLDFKAEIYSWFIQRRVGTIASPLSVRKQYFFTLKTLLAPPNAHLDVEIRLHRP